MTITSQRFNTLISLKRTMSEIQKTKILCPECEKKVQKLLNEIQENIECSCEMGVVG